MSPSSGCAPEVHAVKGLAIAAVLLLAGPASADPVHWYEGSAERRRAIHLASVVGGGALYLSFETFLKDELVPESCRRCAPRTATT